MPSRPLEGEFSRYASSSVDVNRLIACYHAFRLLAEEPEVKADGVSYGQWRDAWCQLVERHDKGLPTEQWKLLPEFEEECQALFAECVKSAMPTEGVKAQVRQVQHQYASRQADKALEEAAARRKAEAEAREQANRVEDELRQREQEAKEKAEAAKAAAEEEKARLTEEAKRAEEALRQKQREYAERVAKAEAEAAAKRKAEREAQEKAKAEQKAAAKLTKAAPSLPKHSEPQQSRAENLLAVAKQGTAKDAAAMAVELITGGDAPDDVFEEVLRQLKASKEMSKASIRAIDAAMLVLNRAAKKEPAAAA